MRTFTLLMSCLVCTSLLSAQDEKLALEAAAMTAASSGKKEAAKKIFMEVLAIDSADGIALHELGKLFEDESPSDASTYYMKAYPILLKQEATKRLNDIDQRLAKINPIGLEVINTFKKYAADVEAIRKRFPNNADVQAACYERHAITPFVKPPPVPPAPPFSAVGNWGSVRPDKSVEPPTYIFKPNGLIDNRHNGDSGTWIMDWSTRTITITWKMYGEELWSIESDTKLSCIRKGVRKVNHILQRAKN